MTPTVASSLKIETTPDGLRAFIRIDPDRHYGGISKSDIIQTLEAKKVAVTEEVRKRAAELADLFVGPHPPTGEFLLARGRPAVEGQDGKFVPAGLLAGPANRPGNDDGGEPDRLDYFAQQNILTIEVGTPIGRIVPARQGRPGVDVFGKAIKPRTRPRDTTLGPNVTIADDGKTVVAAKAGKVAHSSIRNYVDVVEVVEIGGNVDFQTGKIDVHTDVIIRGTVQDLFSVKGKKSIAVGKAVEAAVVEAEGDIHVSGGIVGKGKGRVRAGGELFAKFCDDADVEARIGITIAKEAMNSRIRTDGRLRIANGALIGGKTYAREGAELRSLGSEGEVHTEIAIGTNAAVLARAAGIEQELKPKRETLARIRRSVEPLLGRLDRLSPRQREAAAKLIYKARDLEAEINRIEARRENMLADAKPGVEPVLFVARKIHGGVDVIIDDRIVHFEKELKGPVRIMKKKLDGRAVVVALNTTTRSLWPLLSREHTPEPTADGDQPDRPPKKPEDAGSPSAAGSARPVTKGRR